MEIKVLEKKGNLVKFIIKGTDTAAVNSIRRIIIDEVPTLAVEDLKFKNNDSALYDEFIAHRLGLVPLKTDLSSYKLRTDCKCKGKGCAQCQLVLTLKAKGPCTVYAESIETKDKKVKAVYPKTPIVKLIKKQELDLEGVAVLGDGKDHAKFSPGLAFFQGVPEIKVNKVKNAKECADICPTKVFDASKDSLKVKNSLNCILCMACVDECDGSIEIKGSTKDFIFTVESWGQLSPEEMLMKAVSVLDDKLDKFSKLLKEA